METLDLYNLIGKGLDRIAEKRQELLAKVAEIETYRDWYDKKTKEFFKEWYSTIEKAFIQIGLKPTITNINKTGKDYIIEEDNKLHIGITAEMFGKMKPISWDGNFTKSGSGTKDKRCKEKANKIETFIVANSGIGNVSVNQFSLEIETRKGETSTKVLIDCWF